MTIINKNMLAYKTADELRAIREAYVGEYIGTFRKPHDYDDNLDTIDLFLNAAEADESFEPDPDENYLGDDEFEEADLDEDGNEY